MKGIPRDMEPPALESEVCLVSPGWPIGEGMYLRGKVVPEGFSGTQGLLYCCSPLSGAWGEGPRDHCLPDVFKAATPRPPFMGYGPSPPPIHCISVSFDLSFFSSQSSQPPGAAQSLFSVSLRARPPAQALQPSPALRRSPPSLGP